MNEMTLEQVRDWHRIQALGCNRAGRPWDAKPHTQMADAIDAHLAKAGEPVAAGYCVVSNEDASNYDQILGALGMHEEGDPLREVNWLLDLKEAYRALEARAEWFMESKEVIDFFMDAMPFPATTYIAPGESEHWPAYSHDQMIKIVTDFVRYFGLARNAAPTTAQPAQPVEAVKVTDESQLIADFMARLDAEISSLGGWEELRMKIKLALVDSALAHPRPTGVPDGWQIVPVEPTDAMCINAREKIGIGSNVAHHVWHWMLATAPAPGKERG